MYIMNFKSPVKLKILPGAAVRQTPPANSSPARKKKEVTINPVEEFSPYFRDYDILTEYKLLQDHHSPGVYVLPSFKSLHEWHGVVFVRGGPFRKGIFKFIIYIPDKFPQTRPMLKFKSKLSHPLVHQANGMFNLMRKFPVWEPHTDHIWQILAYMKDRLENPLSLDDDGLDIEPTKKADQPKDEEFMQDAQVCVMEARKNLYTKGDEEEDDYHSIQFKKNNSEVYRKAQELIHSGREAQTKEDTGFFSGFAQQITTFLDSMVTR
ncbi:protein crossbronx homolog isoform X2 [Dysidea avara]|uniref:protein crossbronx homolog isoform X2 n=1 Tax=Dysidea avara TaxID=196820 RepID=UPI00331F3F58